MFSPSACGFSPLEPSPSAEGTPIAAVRFASLPPPVDSSVSSNPKSFDQLTAHLRAMQEGGDHYGKTNCGVMVSYDRADEPSVRWLHAEFMKRYE